MKKSFGKKKNRAAPLTQTCRFGDPDSWLWEQNNDPAFILNKTSVKQDHNSEAPRGGFGFALHFTLTALGGTPGLMGVCNNPGAAGPAWPYLGSVQPFSLSPQGPCRPLTCLPCPPGHSSTVRGRGRQAGRRWAAEGTRTKGWRWQCPTGSDSCWVACIRISCTSTGPLG